MKQQWRRPHIKVITRGSAEESVLLTCKNSGNVVSLGPGTISYGCWIDINDSTNVCRLENVS